MDNSSVFERHAHLSSEDIRDEIADATQAIREHESTIAILEQMIAAHRDGIASRAQTIVALQAVLAQRGEHV